MRHRIAVLLAALVLLLACGDDDKPHGNTLDDTTTTDDGASTTVEPRSTRQVLARLVVQVDDALRVANAAARPCVVGPREQCVGDALKQYDHLDDLAGALRYALDSATNPESALYSGRAADDAVALIDTSLAISDDTKAKALAAQEACLPTPSDACEDASAVLDAAIGELLKDMNAWRDFL